MFCSKNIVLLSLEQNFISDLNYPKKTDVLLHEMYSVFISAAATSLKILRVEVVKHSRNKFVNLGYKSKICLHV